MTASSSASSTAQILEAVAGDDDKPADRPKTGASLQAAQGRVHPVQEPMEGTAELLAEAVVDPGRQNQPQPPAPEP